MYTRERFNSCLYSRLDLAKNGTDRGNRARTEGTRAEPSPPESKFVRIRFSSEDRSSMNVYETSICIELAASTPSSLRLAALSTFDPSSFSDIRLSLSLFLFLREALFSLSLSRALVTRWLRRPCRTLNLSLSPRNSLILSTEPLQGPFPSERAFCLSFREGIIIYLFVYLLCSFIFLPPSFHRDRHFILSLDHCATNRPRWKRARPTIVIDDITP